VPRIPGIPGPYWFFFYSFDCNEPMHVHVRRDRQHAKFWLAPVALALIRTSARKECSAASRHAAPKTVLVGQRRVTPISPPVVKGTDLLRPVVESRRRATAGNDLRITAFPFKAVFVSSAGFHPDGAVEPNTY